MSFTCSVCGAKFTDRAEWKKHEKLCKEMVSKHMKSGK